jgi:hypothetical protein
VLASTEPKEPPYSGCAASKNKCTCYDKRGFPVPVEPEVCTGLVVGSSTVPKHQIDSFLSRVPDMNQVVAQVEQQASDASVLAFMAGR